MKTIEYDPNSYNTTLDELVTALRAGDKVTIVPVDPYCELRKAQEEGEKLQIRYTRDGKWMDAQVYLSFDLPVENYRIKPDNVKMWQWVYQAHSGVIYTTSEFFHSQEDAEEAYKYEKILQRADWTEIEVEQ